MSQCPDGKVRHLKKAERSTTIKEEGIIFYWDSGTP